MRQPGSPQPPDPPRHPVSPAISDPQDDSRRTFLVAGSATVGASLLPIATLTADTGPRQEEAEPVSTEIRLTVNGRERQLAIDTRQSLLDVLRENLLLTGTKKGCNQGACGACTVHANGRRIVSCLAAAALYDGASITTIEGLSNGDELHPLQAAFIDHEGFQCGYCTAGQIMSGTACIQEGHAGSAREVKYWMSGNICRCGAYPGITAAIVEAAAQERQS